MQNVNYAIQGQECFKNGDYEEALNCFLLAKEEEYNYSTHISGETYFYLWLLYDMKGDKENSEKYFKIYSEVLHHTKYANIANEFLEGNHVKQDYQLALSWAMQGLEELDDSSAFILAKMFRDGLGVERNPELAGEYERMANEYLAMRDWRM